MQNYIVEDKKLSILGVKKMYFRAQNRPDYAPRIIQYNNDTDMAVIQVNRHTSSDVDLSVLNVGIITNNEESTDRIIQFANTDHISTEVDDEHLKVKWKIGLNTTVKPGIVRFMITFVDDDNKLVWQSGEYYLQVDPTLSTDEIVAKYPSLLMQYEKAMRKLYGDSVEVLDQAQIEVAKASDQANAAKGFATQAQTAKNTAVEQAQSASVSKDATVVNVTETERLKQEAERYKQEAAQANQECKAAEQRVIALMSTDTRSYFFATLVQRDTAEGLRNCDRCSVLETRADYIYDTNDLDEDQINPEWIKTSDWDALKTVAWEIITGKPNFAAVATSGSYTDLINKPNRYEQFITLADANWDYKLSDKAILTVTQDTAINITNLYNGAIGLIKVYGGVLILPPNSKKSVDFDYINTLGDEHYTYTFVYDGTTFCWSRTVCVNG